MTINKGDVFNSLTFTGNTAKRSGTKYYEFECTCGNKKYWNNLTWLKIGRIKSCGCKQMRSREELIEGKVFGCLILTGKIEIRNKDRVYCECKCKCGKIYFVRNDGLLSGWVKSCGCDKSEKLSIRATKHGLARDNKVHPLFKVWNGIKQRCNNPNAEGYKKYGKVGIKICDEWNNDFLPFYNWAITNGWKKRLTVDRWPNQKGNYEPDNCRIADYPTQSRNRTDNINITAFGETKCLKDWHSDKRCTMSYIGLKDRIVKWKWDAERAIVTPPLNSGNRKIK